MQQLEFKLPPPVIALTSALLMWLTADATPSLVVALPWKREIGLALVMVGLLFDASGFLAFRKARTTINPLKPGNTTTMVSSGIYRVSRNPMYLGLLLNLAGWAVYLAHPLALLGLPVFVAAITRFQIAPEERVLTEKFGAEYLAYKDSVRRWI
ncbi:MAG: isoprenylcysteine carboxylmethyltransferase family protein [Betaproteobacteria bacterium]